MNKVTRKSFILGLTSASALPVAVSGCKSLPSPEVIKVIATTVGCSAGLVCNECDIDDVSRNAIVEIIERVRYCIPATDETFEEKWTPIAREYVDALVADGKLTAKQGELVMAAFALVTKGIDYLFTERYPKAREYTNLVLAGVAGFADGFLSVFKPVDPKSVANVKASKSYDHEAYVYLLQFAPVKK